MSTFPNYGRRPHKYRAQRVEIDGEKFDSKAEARRWGQLKLLEQAGEIKNLQRQVRFPLVVNGIKIGAYVADFTYDAPGRVVEDVKGFRTREFIRTKKLVKACYGIEIKESR